jgi:site-specific recombinase XerC
MNNSIWERLPLVAKNTHAHQWLEMQIKYGLAPNTIDAYGRALEDYLSFCARHCVAPLAATREHVATYVHDLASRPRRSRREANAATPGLANATMQQRLTGVRLFYDFLLEDGLRSDNPVGLSRRRRTYRRVASPAARVKSVCGTGFPIGIATQPRLPNLDLDLDQGRQRHRRACRPS